MPEEHKNKAMQFCSDNCGYFGNVATENLWQLRFLAAICDTNRRQMPIFVVVQQRWRHNSNYFKEQSVEKSSY